MKWPLALFAAPLLLSGCATQANFTAALEKPAKQASATRVVTNEAQRDTARIYTLRLTGDIYPLTSLACTPATSLNNLDGALGAFGEALETIAEVGKAPPDTKYASYVKQFRKNDKYIKEAKTSGTQEAMQKAKDATKAEQQAALQRCTALYSADVVATVKKSSPPDPQAAFGISAFFALNELIKAGLAAGEGVQRERAVELTASALTPGLRAAYTQLSDAPDKAFAPYIDYSAQSATNPAVTMNKSQLGAALNIHRWLLAQRIAQLDAAIGKTRNLQCLADANCRRNLDDLITAIEEYRTLAAVDAVVILDALDSGIKKAEAAADGKQTWAQFLDGLLAVADAINGINDKYDAYQTSKE